MSKLNLTIWIINLERSKDRFSSMVALMDKYALEHEFIKAVDGQMLSKATINKYYSPIRAFFNCARTLNRGEIGCALSHIRCWERIIQHDLKEVLILEDDIFFEDNLIQVLKRRQDFPKDWEFINLKTDVQKIPFGQAIYKDYRMAQFNRFHNRLAAYMINRKGAEKLLKMVFPIRMPIDGSTGRDYLCNKKAYGIFPESVYLLDIKSTIQIEDLDKIKTTSGWKKIVIKIATKIFTKKIAHRIEKELHRKTFLPLHLILLRRDRRISRLTNMKKFAAYEQK